MYVKAQAVEQREPKVGTPDVYIGGPYSHENYYVVEVQDVGGTVAQVRMSKSEMRALHAEMAGLLGMEQQTVNVQVSIPSIVDLTVERT